MAELTVYPDGNALDGWVTYRTGASGSWSEARDAATGTGVNYTAAQTTALNSREHTSASDDFICTRGFFFFDTSALGAGATVSAAVMSIKIVTIKDGESGAANIYSSSVVSDTVLAVEDIDLFGTTAFATAIAFSAMSTPTYSDWTFNASGLAAISDTSVSKFCLREQHDYNDSAPGTNTETSLDVYMSEQGGTDRPKIVITYTPGAPAGPATLKTADTIAKANIKTRNGVAIASVKTWDTAV